MAHIVLAHGFLGIGSNPLNPGIHYFNGVAKALRDQDHEVFEPTVDALGALEHRSQQLASKINQHWPGTFDIAVIAHSMGGLDTRRILARDNTVGPRIRTLIAIATPHFGSPVADAMLDHTHALRASIPAPLLFALQNNDGALEDLRTRTVLQDPDKLAGVRYMEVVCGAQENNDASPLFNLCRAIGKLSNAKNDGVVTVQSAKAPARIPIEIWPVDHGAAIGWPSSFGFDAFAALISPPQDHIDRYISLAARL